MFAAIVTACIAGWCAEGSFEDRFADRLACQQHMIRSVEQFTDAFPMLGIRDMRCRLIYTPEMMIASSAQVKALPPKPRPKPEQRGR